MLKNISERFYQWNKGWLVFVLFLLDAFFSGFLLPLIQGMLQGGQGGVQPLDLMLFASPEKIFGMIERYGEYGRPFYRGVELTVDILYPIVYLFFFGLLISWLFQRGFASTNPMRKFNIVPLGAWFFDLLENIVIVILLSVYPSQPTALAWILILLSTVKWFFAGASMLLILVGLVMAINNYNRAMSTLSPSAQKIQNLLRELGYDYTVIEHAESTRTAQEAADRAGCELAQIVKSLIFRGKTSGKPILVLTSGANRVDEKRISGYAGETISRADADFVRSVTGFAIGGVPPIGHNRSMETYLDEDFLPFKTIWAAAGTPNAIFELKTEDLQKMTGGTVAQVK